MSGASTTTVLALLAALLAVHASAQNGFSPSCKYYPKFSSGGAAVGRSNFRVISNASRTCASDATFDLMTRWNSGLFSTSPLCYTNFWGPQPKGFPRPTINQPCLSNFTGWSQQRLLSLISFVVSQDFDYCHHHLPTWTPPVPTNLGTCCKPGQTTGCDCPSETRGRDLTCSICTCARGLASTRGLDCTSYTSMLYNIAFGLLLNADTAAQACSPSFAPGVIVTNNTASDVPSRAQPGDILYIYQTGGSVSHGIVWTGYQADLSNRTQFGIKQMLAVTDANDLQATISDIRAMLAAGQPVWVISDSHHVGPNYRPFAGWYRTNFSHMRRIINAASVTNPVPPDVVYTYVNGACFNHLGQDARRSSR